MTAGTPSTAVQVADPLRPKYVNTSGVVNTAVLGISGAWWVHCYYFWSDWLCIGCTSTVFLCVVRNGTTSWWTMFTTRELSTPPTCPTRQSVRHLGLRSKSVRQVNAVVSYVQQAPLRTNGRYEITHMMNVSFFHIFILTSVAQTNSEAFWVAVNVRVSMVAEAENIKVAVRVRPFSEREIDLGAQSTVTMSGRQCESQGTPIRFWEISLR